MIRKHINSIRYEYGAWPLWRIDKSLRYILKSHLHKRVASVEDQQHYTKSFAYLAKRSWQSLAEQPIKQLSFSCVGDLMWLGRNGNNYLSQPVSEQLAKTDLRIVNLETPIDPSQPVPRFAYTKFNAPVSFLKPWQRIHKATLFSLCNNHIYDQGRQGVTATRAVIESIPMHFTVGGLEASQQWRILEINDVKIAVIGMTFGINRWHRECKDKQFSHSMIELCVENPDPESWRRIQEIITHCKAIGVDLIVALPHWGFEYEYWPEAKQRASAYHMIKLGVDIIIGSSPHVLQPFEIVSINDWDRACPIQLHSSGKPRFGLIAYSLGNFATTLSSSVCRSGVILEINISINHKNQLTLLEINPILTVSLNSLASKGNPLVYLLDRVKSSYLYSVYVSDYYQHAKRVFYPFL